MPKKADRAFHDTRPQLGVDEAGRAARSIIKLLEGGVSADSERLTLSLTRLVGALGGNMIASHHMTGPQLLLYVIALQQLHIAHGLVDDEEDQTPMSVTMPQGAAPRAHTSVGPKTANSTFGGLDDLTKHEPNDGLSAYRTTRQSRGTK